VTPRNEDPDSARPVTPRTRLARYRGFFAARRVVSRDPAVPWPTLTGERRLDAFMGFNGPDGLDPSAELVLVVGADTVRKSLPLNLLLADPARPRTGVGRDLDPPDRNGDGKVIARPGPGGGPYHYVWVNGVELELTGERNGAYRVRLTDDLSAWTPAGDVQLRVGAVPPPESRVSVVRLDPQPEWVDVRVALDRRLPYRVEEDDGSVGLVVYGAVSRVNFLQHGRVDAWVDRAEWSQPSDRAFRLDVKLNGPVWGYETLWSGGDLVLRLRRPPAIDPAAPLRGLTIGVDPGHGGTDTLTMGPTGLTEADANLGVARALRTELENRGARVVMTRAADTEVSLVERTQQARRQDVDVWISVHNNAFPDGVEPWANNGTSVYYNHPRAAGLAWSVQRALLEELGLRDLGVGRADLHQTRFTWAPAILSETMFMMIPRQEAFLKTEAGRQRVARAHIRGLEAWLRSVAAAEQPGR
jgi:N-acetylmuramoyl-L-alanine amidase